GGDDSTPIGVRRIEQMPEPRAVGQSGIVSEESLGAVHQVIDLVELSPKTREPRLLELGQRAERSLPCRPSRGKSNEARLDRGPVERRRRGIGSTDPFDLGDVAPNRRREAGELERKHGGVREAEENGSGGRGQRSPVLERRITESPVPVERVVDR